MKLKHFLNLSLIGLLLMSCQSEENEVIQDTSQNLAKSSPLTNLISRVSQNPTSTDNVLDNSSCFSVVLPATVIVNGQNIVVSNQADYQTVQDAIDAFSNDDDIVNFVYPITVQFQNFTTLVVQNSDVLDDIMDDCGEDDGFDEIECINFNFPIVVNIYNANNQLAETISITNNVQLYIFLESLEDNEYIAIQYPISVTNSNNQTIVISNNDQFEDVIEDAIDDCDDDSQSPGGNGNLSAILTDGIWYVSYFYDDTNQTSMYAGYTFTFNSNGTSQAMSNGNFLNGSWSNYMDGAEEKIELDYDSSILDELEDDWEVIEYSSTQIRLKDVSGGNGGTDYLYLSKN